MRIKARWWIRGFYCVAIVSALVALTAGTAAAASILPKTDSQEVSVATRFMTPAGEARYGLLKQQAAVKPGAPEADLLSAPAPSGPAPLASVATSFTGLDRPGAVNNGSIFYPPDTIVAKSSARVIEAANSALRMFDVMGNVTATKDLNTFFGASATDGLLFDPKIYYDRTTKNKRFYVIALQQSYSPELSKIWIAVSRSADPANLAATNWCRYSVSGKWDGGTSWADYPGLGVGADALIISTNQFTFSKDTFTFAVVRAFNKLKLANNATFCPSAAKFEYDFQASAGAFTLQPVQHYTAPSSFTSGATTKRPAYLLSTEFGSSNVYHVWRVRNMASGAPDMQEVSVSASFTYDIPPAAPQSAGMPLDSGDDRMVQAAGIGDNLFGVHATLCNLGGGANESCVRYVRIKVGQDGSGNPTASIAEQKTFGGGDGVFYFWPGIAANIAKQVIVPFQRSSADSFLSAWWTMKDLASKTFPAASPITVGTCAQPYDRTGDFVGAQTDPSDFSSFWIAGERATDITAGGVDCNWETQIMKITP